MSEEITITDEIVNQTEEAVNKLEEEAINKLEEEEAVKKLL